ncbi:MAG: hypothetical protein K8F36_13720 [Melioribacteraceae bacterium]|nr:hypothetical protein [Melioribacteraceae bacterium]MCO6473813.1 hypothetical protein [Melioribacteraceae bacterium]MDD3558376.1 hypothetical protein [Melioribacteraceae bacterium]
MKNAKLIIISVAILFLLSGCVPGDGSSTIDDPSGLFSGIWHGWIAPVTLIWGIFDNAIRIYEPINTGWWYDFGYYIAIIGGFGGLSLFRKKKGDD